MTSQRQFLLGLLFIAALAVLGYYTLFLTDFRLFREVHQMTVAFPEAGGLRKGDAVLVAGIRMGKVGSMAYDPEGPDDARVTVGLVMDEEVPLRQGYAIRIAAATLLGGHNVIIDPGPGGAASLPAGTSLAGQLAPDALTGLSELVADNRDKIDSILANVDDASNNLQVLLADLREGQGLVSRLFFDEALGNSGATGIEAISTTFTNMQTLTDSVLAGRGVVGKLFTDEDLVVATERIARNLDAISSELRGITADVSEGRGTLGRLLRDETIADDVSQALTSLRSLVDKINSGEGSLGRLIVDDTLIQNLDAITAGLAEGRGTLGRLLTEDMVYRNLVSASDDLAVVLGTLREGRGTIGKLVADDELYQDLRQALGVVNRSLEEFREVAPVSSFTNILFGAF